MAREFARHALRLSWALFTERPSTTALMSRWGNPSRGCAGAGSVAGGGSLQTLLVSAVRGEGVGFASRIGCGFPGGGARSSLTPGYLL